MMQRRDGKQQRVGVASIIQETNTWSPVSCTLDDFLVQGLVLGEEVWERYGQTNTEVGGALRAAGDAGSIPVPILRAWANSSGRLTRQTLDRLCDLFVAELRKVQIDGLVLALHGAMAAEGEDDADAAVLQAARDALGWDIPIAVCLDLHANITFALTSSSNLVIGFHTYPHTDLAATGARATNLLIAQLDGSVSPVTRHSKRPMVVPAEAMSTSAGPMARLRVAAEELSTMSVLDISLFPVQPWLDVEELGFAVTVTTDGDADLASDIAESLADEAWKRRGEFKVSLLSPEAAIRAARASSVRPFLISESADAPTAGASGDSPVMVRALLEHGRDLHCYVTVTDPPAVVECRTAGIGGRVDLMVGAGIDGRFHQPVHLSGQVLELGDRPVVLTGPSYTGMEVSMGRFAVVKSGRLSVLLTERPAFTLDPATFVHAGLDPARADIIVVRSATGFKAAYPEASVASAVLLDLPGASTPRLELLDYTQAPRPLYPLDQDFSDVVVRR